MFQTVDKNPQEPSLPTISIEVAIQRKLWPKVKEKLESSIEAGNFYVENLEKALSAGADLSGLDLSSLPQDALKGVKFSGGKLSRARLPSMNDVEFKNVDLSEASFANVDLIAVKFDSCNLDKAYFRDSKLERTEFVGEGSMREAKIFDSNLSSTTFSLKDLSGVQLFSSSFDDVDFSSQQMLGASIISMKLTKCNFSGADLRACDVVLSQYDSDTKWDKSVFVGTERVPQNFKPFDRGAVRGSLEGVKLKVPKKSWRNFSARAGNPIPGLRLELDKLAKEIAAQGSSDIKLDGRGQSILHLEQVPDAVGDRARHSMHSSAVRARIMGSSESGGLATGINYELRDMGADFAPASTYRLVQDSKEAFVKLIVSQATELSSQLNTELEKLALEQDKAEGRKVDSVVVSMGVSKARLYDQHYAEITAQSFPEIHKAIYGIAEDRVDNAESRQKFIDFIDSVLDSKEVSESFSRYDETIDKLWEQGTLVVISAGNDRELREKFEEGLNQEILKYKGSPELNFLARGKVISVASSESNSTPSKANDDLISSFSSRGDAKNHPSLTANGEAVLINYDIIDGTSFSAPLVASVIAIMRQANSELNSAEILKLLKESCYDNPGVSSALEGAGNLRIVDAIRAAWRKSK